MDFKDYYKILDVDPSASKDEIKRVYKRLARKYHPDVSEEDNAQKKFQEVSEAYEVLKNKEKRAEYDELREYVNNPAKFQNGREGQHFQFDQDFSAGNGLEDLLRSIFEQQSTGKSQGNPFNSQGFGSRVFSAKGQDIRYKINVSLEDAFNGAAKEIELARPNERKTLRVKIPKGVTSGKEIRLKGMGEPGISGGAAGDVYLGINLERHASYEVEGNDLTFVLTLTPWDAALGASVSVPTLGGLVNLKIPANSRSGTKLRLKGRGLGLGDQYVILNIDNPAITSEQQRALFEEMRQSFATDRSETTVGSES